MSWYVSPMSVRRVEPSRKPACLAWREAPCAAFSPSRSSWSWWSARGSGSPWPRFLTGDEHAAALLREQLATWNDAQARDALRANLRRYGPEWDFMHRTFLVLSLADAALAQPGRRDELLGVMDGIIESTLAEEAAHGQRWFLMAYVDHAPSGCWAPSSPGGVRPWTAPPVAGRCTTDNWLSTRPSLTQPACACAA